MGTHTKRSSTLRNTEDTWALLSKRSRLLESPGVAGTAPTVLPASPGGCSLLPAARAGLHAPPAPVAPPPSLLLSSAGPSCPSLPPGVKDTWTTDLLSLRISVDQTGKALTAHSAASREASHCAVETGRGRAPCPATRACWAWSTGSPPRAAVSTNPVRFIQPCVTAPEPGPEARRSGTWARATGARGGGGTAWTAQSAPYTSQSAMGARASDRAASKPCSPSPPICLSSLGRVGGWQRGDRL